MPHSDLDAALQTRMGGMGSYQVRWVRGHVEKRKKTSSSWSVVETGNFIADAIAEADAVFIAVGTPSRRGDGHADLSYVYSAAEEIAELMDGFTVVVTKSRLK